MKLAPPRWLTLLKAIQGARQSKTANNYQKTLRAIGQGLETLRVEKIEIEAGDDHYLINGYCSRPKSVDAPKQSLFKEAFLYLRGRSKTHFTARTPQKEALSSFEFNGLRITQKDIDEFERKGKELSANSKDGLDPNSASQVLRLVGAYLDYRKSALLKLSWRNQTVTLWRKDGLGVESKEIFTPANLYDLWVHRYKQRKPNHSTQTMKKTGSD